jgi:hypothetical protein
VYSNINIDGTNTTWSPSGQASIYGVATTAPNDALAPGLKLGALIAKVGREGRPFQLFTDASSHLQGYRVNSSEEVFIAINDSYFADNRGEHIVIVEGSNLNFEGTASSGSQAVPQAATQSHTTAGYSQSVALPSMRYGTQSKSYFRVSIPSNWKAVEDRATLTIYAPDGAYGRQGITHGVLLGLNQAQSSDLEGATRELISGILGAQSNAYLRQVGRAFQATLDGRPALTTRLVGRSPVSGRNEQVVIVTALIGDGRHFYLGAVAPLLEYHQYRQTFDAILQSVHITGR